MEKSEKITIFWKAQSSAFANQVDNKKVIGESTRRIGGSQSAINKMLACGDESKLLMPTLLGLSSNSPNWDTRVKQYWNDLSVEVTQVGKELEIGFNYNINDVSREKYLKEFKEIVKSKFKTDISTDEELYKFIGKVNIEETEKYKYATPISVEDYILWRYCLVHREVANNIEDVDKSGSIRFYMYSELEKTQAKVKMYELSNSAMKKYLEIIASEELVDALLYVYQDKFTGLDAITKATLVQEHMTADPRKFLTLSSDTALNTKALIEKYISYNILKRLASTSIVVDASDPEFVLGNTLDEVIAFFNSTDAKSKTHLNEFAIKYKALI
jgi:hypothetical protein